MVVWVYGRVNECECFVWRNAWTVKVCGKVCGMVSRVQQWVIWGGGGVFVSNSDGCVSRLNLGRHHTEVGIDGEATTRRRRYGV